MKSTEKTVFEITLLIALLLALVLLPMQAWSQESPTGEAPDQRGPIPFNTMDTNGDGEVSEDEFSQARAERMASRAEEGRPMKNKQDMPTFDSIDTDGNGALSEAELVAHQQAHRAARMGGGQGHGKSHGQGGGKGKGKGMPTFEDFDADNDGCISREELLAVQKARHPERF